MIGYAEFRDYFENLAVQHTEINHSPSEVGFFTIDPLEMISGIKNRINNGRYIMILMSFHETLNHCEKAVNFVFFIMHKTKNGDFTENDVLRDGASKIAKDIIGRINEDSQDFQDQNLMKMWIGSMDKIQNVDIIHDRLVMAGEMYVGVQCSFQAKSEYCVGYRPNIFADKL